MSDTKPVPRGTAPEVLVRGGTTSGAHDRQRAESAHASELGRQRLARQERAAAAGPTLNEDGFQVAKLHSLKLMDSASPRLVLYYMNRDRTVKQECVSELVVAGTDELFTMVCPKCLERGEPMGQCQMKIHKSHRKFDLDVRKAGTVVELRDPDGVPFHVRICGTVSCDDIIACDTCGLFRVRIHDSKVWEV